MECVNSSFCASAYLSFHSSLLIPSPPPPPSSSSFSSSFCLFLYSSSAAATYFVLDSSRAPGARPLQCQNRHKSNSVHCSRFSSSSVRLCLSCLVCFPIALQQANVKVALLLLLLHSDFYFIFLNPAVNLTVFSID